jgi:dolichyl-diphosphooligosaccharide--protein glycosyltransferase
MLYVNYTLIPEQEKVSEPWMETLHWMQKNTPDESYGVLSAGKYGNYIQVIGERAPVVSPYVKSNISTEFFAAQSEDEAVRVLRDAHVKYIITDISMATVGFTDVTGMKPANYSENITFVSDRVKRTDNVTVYMPNDTYYNSMLMKLHLLNGEGLKHFKLVYESESSGDVREIELKNMYNVRYSMNLSGYSGDVKIFEYIFQ